jgi:hypothetical protein
MADIDDLLNRVRQEPVHPGLVDMDVAVLNAMRVRNSQDDRLGARTLGLGALAALFLGIAGTTLPHRPAQSSVSTLPFGAPLSLAPSTLLTEAHD